eukprot:CRZ06867.1 hypothetical protein [Spongospora subterranea]
MSNMADELSLNRTLSAGAIWTRISQELISPLSDSILKVLTKTQILRRVSHARNGSRAADRLQDVEQPELSLSMDGMTSFLCFNTPFYEGTTQGRVTGWGLPGLYCILRRSNVHVFIDATFRSVPAPFSQLLIVMAKDDDFDLYLPVFYILMTGKSRRLYEFCLRQINAAVEADISPGSICCDFEVALMGAIKRIYPATPITGCFFHWKQAVRRRLMNIGVSSETFNRLMRPGVLDVLTLIPHSEITTTGFDFIRSNVSDFEEDGARLEEFFDYFERIWIKKYSPNDWNISRQIAQQEEIPIERTIRWSVTILF